MSQFRARFQIATLFTALGALVLPAPRAAAVGVPVSILPYPAGVDTSEVFDLEITIPSAGDEFNGFTADIVYDPGRLTFIPLPVANQVGTLFTGVCAGPYWHIFTAAPETLHVDLSMLCAGVFVTGPGVAYKLRFRAGTIPGYTDVRFANIRFARAGVWVDPAIPEDGLVLIGGVTGIPGPKPEALLRLTAPRPNPMHGSVAFTVERAEGGSTRVELFSVAGHRIRLLTDGFLPSGRQPMVWDGRDDGGAEAPPGIYFVRATGAGASVSRRLVKLN